MDFFLISHHLCTQLRLQFNCKMYIVLTNRFSLEIKNAADQNCWNYSHSRFFFHNFSVICMKLRYNMVLENFF